MREHRFERWILFLETLFSLLNVSCKKQISLEDTCILNIFCLLIIVSKYIQFKSNLNFNHHKAKLIRFLLMFTDRVIKTNLVFKFLLVLCVGLHYLLS